MQLALPWKHAPPLPPSTRGTRRLKFAQIFTQLLPRQTSQECPSLVSCVQSKRRCRTVTREAAAELTHIANSQFQLERALNSRINEGPPQLPDQKLYQGLVHATQQINTALEYALSIRTEDARAMVFSEIYPLTENSKAAVSRWKGILELGHRTGNEELIKCALDWLAGPDDEACQDNERAPEYLGRSILLSSPLRYDKQSLALMKP